MSVRVPKNNLWRAIAEKCMGCCCGYREEVRHCPSKCCSLRPHRPHQLPGERAAFVATLRKAAPAQGSMPAGIFKS